MTLPTIGPNPNADTDADNIRDDETGETDARNVRSARNGTGPGVGSGGGGAPGGNVRDPDPPVDPVPNQAPIAALSVLGVSDLDVTVSTAGTIDGDGTIVSGTVNWGDGTVVSFTGAPDATYSNTYNEAGSYVITLTVLDNDFAGAAATAAVTVDVEAPPANQSPVAALTFVSGDFTGDPVVLSTAGTDDPDGTIASWEMDWDDGAPDTGSGDPPATFDHTYATAGTYTTVFTVTDDDAAEGSIELDVVVQDPLPGDPPDTTFTLDSGSLLGEAFVFSLDGSDPDLGPVTWTLDFGDGSTVLTGDGDDLPTTRSRTYATAGTYLAVFRVTDSEDLITTKTIVVTVTAPEIDLPPEVFLTYVSGQYRGEPYILAVNVDFTVHDDIASGTLTWGDGESDTWSASDVEYTHTYANAGFYTATITLVDEAGQTGSASRQVQIESRPAVNQSPTANLTRIGGAIVGDTYVFSTTGSFDPDGSIASATFNPGDGGASMGWAGPPDATFSQQYNTVGSFTATLTVTDNQGATDQDTVNVTVAAVPDPPDPGSHQYFNTLMARPERVFGWGLRSQAELNSLVADSPSGQTYLDSLGEPYQAGFNYDPGSDLFADAQDAARFLVNPHTNAAGVLKNNIPIGQQLQFNWGTALFPPGSRCLITWDFWWGEDFRTNRGQTTNWKTWMITTHSKKRTWTMVDNLGRPSTVSSAVSTRHDECSVGMGSGPYDDNTGTGFAGVDGVVYPTYPNGLGRAEGIAAVGPSAGPGAPNQRPFGAPNGVIADHTCWTRYVIEVGVGLAPSAFSAWNAGLGVTVQANPNDPTGQGRWNMLSVWVISAARGVRRSLFRCPINFNLQQWIPNVDGFRAEFNTSKSNPAGDFHGYLRNVVVLKNYGLSDLTPESDSRIFSTQDLA